MSLDDRTGNALRFVAHFYDQRKVGDTGYLGFRRSTDLSRLSACLDTLIEKGLLVSGESLFLDMGCGDGRVNVLFSYLVRKSIGIEMDEWTLDEYVPLKEELFVRLKKDHLPLPPQNIYLFYGNTMDENLHRRIFSEAGLYFEDYDIFYTYLTMHEEFAGLISRKAKKGALFMVYGLENVLPRLDGLRLLTPQKPLEGILALYQKE
ncbi:MAG: hypothetical protein JRI79_04060 [Deltaproteobacteria bacterium]|nr:hypothetical protein [Deltaproteobacteria bacterium]MBW1936387.1 hypothetical protein [Deltaproteobacteria bacterium]MBW1977134.1 hypothetical protein [Deltaproteobacteria bacterium]MBW2043579.1 hypothetical protein [Deltaproteobacteria bacterium]MBW2299065.1 hypothetical protein [Deltaproteobacteria bacterium]